MSMFARLGAMVAPFVPLLVIDFNMLNIPQYQINAYMY